MGDEFAAMFVSEISLWGAAIVACVVLVAAIALAFFDSQMLRPVSVAMLVGSIVVGGSAMLMPPPSSPIYWRA
jgi:RsiW-degrading membrane proteinase PrsW (M82 family)